MIAKSLTYIYIYIYIIFQLYVCPVVLLGGKGVRVNTSFINAFPWLPFSRNRPLHLSPLFNTTTLIKPMNEEEEEAPLEDPRVCRNCLAWERHVARFEEQHAVNASQRAVQRSARSDAQIAMKKPSFEATCIS